MPRAGARDRRLRPTCPPSQWSVKAAPSMREAEESKRLMMVSHSVIAFYGPSFKLLSRYLVEIAILWAHTRQSYAW